MSADKIGCSRVAVLVAALCLVPTHVSARTPMTTATARKAHARGQALTSPSRRKSKAKSSHSRRHNRKSSRRADLHLQPERIQQIQAALRDAGELHEQPTGVWDAETKAAMAHYQAFNGFPVTGLPDAKSLMKLGLGPHPLPAELDRASLRSSEGSASPSAGSPEAKPENPRDER